MVNLHYDCSKSCERNANYIYTTFGEDALALKDVWENYIWSIFYNEQSFCIINSCSASRPAVVM